MPYQKLAEARSRGMPPKPGGTRSDLITLRCAWESERVRLACAAFRNWIAGYVLSAFKHAGNEVPSLVRVFRR